MSSEINGQRTALMLWQEHTSARREEPDYTVQVLLEKAYPDFLVTRTSPSMCDLLGFAEAGHAVAVPVLGDGRDVARVYRAPPSGVNGQKGKLEDVVNFGLWDYTWNDTDFKVYEVKYMDCFARVVRLLYLLSPRPCTDSLVLQRRGVDPLLLEVGEWTSKPHEQIWVFDSAKWVKDKALWDSVAGMTPADVIMSAATKSKLDRDVHGFFNNQRFYQASKVPWRRGIIFHGVPGVGKTFFIKMLIKSLNDRLPLVSTLYVKSLDACAGPKWSIQQIFNKARRSAPCLLVLEDLDSLVGDDTRSYFLNEVDGLNSNDGILMIGSTNHLERLDPSITKRPSRFDRKYHFALPTEDERLAYCHYWRTKLAGSADVEFSEDVCLYVSKITKGFSFAYMKELFVSSLVLQVGGQEDHSTEADSRQHDESTDTAEKPQLPDVELPLSAQNNNLVKVLRKQAEVLLEDMGKSQEEKAPHPNASRPPPPAYFMENMLDEFEQI